MINPIQFNSKQEEVNNFNCKRVSPCAQLGATLPMQHALRERLMPFASAKKWYLITLRCLQLQKHYKFKSIRAYYSFVSCAPGWETKKSALGRVSYLRWSDHNTQHPAKGVGPTSQLSRRAKRQREWGLRDCPPLTLIAISCVMLLATTKFAAAKRQSLQQAAWVGVDGETDMRRRKWSSPRSRIWSLMKRRTRWLLKLYRLWFQCIVRVVRHFWSLIQIMSHVTSGR